MSPHAATAEIRRLVATALSIADACRDTVLAASPARRRERKADASFVTDLDLAVETLVRERLRVACPGHAIVGEELAAEGDRTATYEWVVDPIDGTHSLVHGVPLFGTLLAVRKRVAGADGVVRATPIVGVIDLPRLALRYHAGKGIGAFRNGRRIRVRDAAPADVPDEIVAMGERRQFASAGLLPLFDRLLVEQGRARIYPDCFGHALALEGAVGAMVDPDLNVWDVAATLAIAAEAGCRVERLPAAPGREERFNLVLGKPAVVEKILATAAAVGG